MRAAVLVLTLMPLAAVAQETDPPLDAQDFEAMVQGKTMDTLDSTGRYGVETFLPGRRAIWRDAERCLEGSWRAVGPLICFEYEGVSGSFCWTYHDRGGWLEAWLDGDRDSAVIELRPSSDFVTCDGFLGA